MNRDFNFHDEESSDDQESSDPNFFTSFGDSRPKLFHNFQKETKHGRNRAICALAYTISIEEIKYRTQGNTPNTERKKQQARRQAFCGTELKRSENWKWKVNNTPDEKTCCSPSDDHRPSTNIINAPHRGSRSGLRRRWARTPSRSCSWGRNNFI